MPDHKPGSVRFRLASSSLVLAAALSLAAAPPAAGEGRIVAPRAGQTLRAGETVEVRWTGFDRPVDELEILLNVDGSGRFPVRLTEQLDPRPGCLLWRVPDLPTPSAHLVVRFGRGGRELLAEPGGSFRIVCSAPGELPAPGFANGEWWLGRGSPSAPVNPGKARPTADWLPEIFRCLPALARGGHQWSGTSKRPPTAAETAQRRQTARPAVPRAFQRSSHGLPRLE